METIYKNDEILALTAGSYIILDASIIRIDIKPLNGVLCIDIYFTSVKPKAVTHTGFKLSFINVLQYSLYWNAQHHFYNVERYKLLDTKDGFYISLDPADELREISEDDQDVIVSRRIEGCFF